MTLLTRKQVEKLRQEYPAGTRIRLIRMEGENIPSGTVGTVSMVDDAGNIHMRWKTGGSLSLIDGVDEFEKE